MSRTRFRRGLAGLGTAAMLAITPTAFAQESGRPQDESRSDSYQQRQDSSQQDQQRRQQQQRDYQQDQQRNQQDQQRFQQDEQQDRQDQQRYQQDQQFQQGQERFQQDQQRYRQDQFRQDPQSSRPGSDQGRAGGEMGGLGVTVVDDGGRGIRIRQIFPQSPAQEAGLQVNDEILEIDDQRVMTPEQFVSIIRGMRPDSQIQLRINRDGRTRSLVARLEPRREALNLQAQRPWQQGRGPWQGQRPWQDQQQWQQGQARWQDQDSDQDYNTPSGYNDLIDHIYSLEQQVRVLSNELADLRQMVQSDPNLRASSRPQYQQQQQQRD